jgi:hypothetical protein
VHYQFAYFFLVYLKMLLNVTLISHKHIHCCSIIQKNCATTIQPHFYAQFWGLCQIEVKLVLHKADVMNTWHQWNVPLQPHKFLRHSWCINHFLLNITDVSCRVLAPSQRTMIWLIYTYTHTKCHLWPTMSNNDSVHHSYPLSQKYLISSVYHNVYNTIHDVI